MNHSPSRAPAALLAAAAAMLLLGAADRDSVAGRRPANTPAPPRPAVSGMVVAVDPNTGRLTAPSRDQLLRLSSLEQRMLSHSDIGLVERRLANGAVALDLDGRFQEFLVVHIGPHGRRIYACFDALPPRWPAERPAGAGRDSLGLEVR